MIPNSANDTPKFAVEFVGPALTKSTAIVGPPLSVAGLTRFTQICCVCGPGGACVALIREPHAASALSVMPRL